MKILLSLMTILYYYEHSCLCSVFPANSLSVTSSSPGVALIPSIHPSIHLFFLHSSERAHQLDRQTDTNHPPPPLSLSLDQSHPITLHLHRFRIYRLFFAFALSHGEDGSERRGDWGGRRGGEWGNVRWVNRRG